MVTSRNNPLYARLSRQPNGLIAMVDKPLNDAQIALLESTVEASLTDGHHRVTVSRIMSEFPRAGIRPAGLVVLVDHPLPEEVVTGLSNALKTVINSDRNVNAVVLHTTGTFPPPPDPDKVPR